MRRQLFVVSLLTLALAGVSSCAGREPGDVNAPPVPPGIDPFCSTRPGLGFCEDFDVAELPGGLDEVVEDGGTASRGPDAVSPPHALQVVTDDVDTATVGLRKTFGPGIKHRLFTQMRVDDVSGGFDDDASADIAAIEFASDTAEGWRVGYRVDADGVFSAFAQKDSDVEPTIFPITQTIEPGVFTSVRLDVIFNDELAPPGACPGLGAFLLGRFRDETVIDCVPLDPPDTAATSTLALGLTSRGGGVWAAAYDNLTFDVHTE